MVKTTINLEDKLYEEIVKESIEKYGSTKNISRVINQRLKNSRETKRNSGKRLSFTVDEENAGLDVDREIKKVWEGES